MQQTILPARYVGNSVKHSHTLGSLWLQELACGIQDLYVSVLVPFPLLWYNATAIKERFNLGTHCSGWLEYTVICWSTYKIAGRQTWHRSSSWELASWEKNLKVYPKWHTYSNKATPPNYSQLANIPMFTFIHSTILASLRHFSISR